MYTEYLGHATSANKEIILLDKIHDEFGEAAYNEFTTYLKQLSRLRSEYAHLVPAFITHYDDEYFFHNFKLSKKQILNSFRRHNLDDLLFLKDHFIALNNTMHAHCNLLQKTWDLKKARPSKNRATSFRS